MSRAARRWKRQRQYRECKERDRSERGRTRLWACPKEGRGTCLSRSWCRNRGNLHALVLKKHVPELQQRYNNSDEASVDVHDRRRNSMFDARHELCFLEFVSDLNASSKSKSVKKAKKKEELKPTGKVLTKIGYSCETKETSHFSLECVPLN
ncbi:hypothetical protein Tco_0339762 [Tanacetum coccineum]